MSRLVKVANKAPALFKGSEPTVKRQILKLLLQNCQVNGATLCPTYRSPFGAFAKGASHQKWLPGQGSNLGHGDYDLPSLPRG